MHQLLRNLFQQSMSSVACVQRLPQDLDNLFRELNQSDIERLAQMKNSPHISIVMVRLQFCIDRCNERFMNMCD